MLLVTWRDTGSVGSFSPTVQKHANFQTANKIPFSGNLLKEKTFANFAVLWLFAKIFSTNFGV